MHLVLCSTISSQEKKIASPTKRVSNLQHRNSNTFHLPTWLTIPLSLSSFLTQLIHVGERELGEMADILQQTPENHNHRTEIPPGRAGVP